MLYNVRVSTVYLLTLCGGGDDDEYDENDSNNMQLSWAFLHAYTCI